MVGWLLAVPVVIKVFSALALVLVLNAYGRHLAESLLAGTLLLAFWCGHTPAAIVRIACDRTFSVDHFLLLLVTTQVIWLSSQMAKAGVMRDLVLAVGRRLPQRMAIAVLPALIGLLPMPGGALFSAPLVDDCDHAKSIDSELKTRINYWFRHVWEYWWPLYPGVLLMLAITGIDVWQIVLLHLPLSVVAVAVGAFFLLRKIPRQEEREADGAPLPEPANADSLPALLAPVFAVIGVYAVIKVGVKPLAEINRYVPMIIGIGVAILLQQVRRPLGWSDWRGILLSRRTLMLALLVTMVRVYGAFIEAPLPGTGGELLVERMQTEFRSWGIPVLAVASLIPFVCGVATGLAIGFVGASFPIVMSVLGANPTPAALYATTILAYGFGYMGMILSPVHICLIVTNEHFETSLTRSLRGLTRPALVVMVFTFVYSRVVGLALERML
jgi:integral membrane protein (TIGR00529 family)